MQMNPVEINSILTVLSALRLPAMPEENEIHTAIERALTEAGIAYTHEAKLGPGCRIDFLCGSIGIEVKKGRPAASVLTKQLTRYLAFDALNAIIVVLQRPCGIPEQIGGKHVYSLALDRLWGVALA